MSITLLWCFCIYFTPFPSVSIVNVEQLNISWDSLHLLVIGYYVMLNSVLTPFNSDKKQGTLIHKRIKQQNILREYSKFTNCKIKDRSIFKVKEYYYNMESYVLIIVSTIAGESASLDRFIFYEICINPFEEMITS